MPNAELVQFQFGVRCSMLGVRCLLRWLLPNLRRPMLLRDKRYRALPLGNMTLSGCSFSAAKSLGISRVLIEPASRGGTR